MYKLNEEKISRARAREILENDKKKEYTICTFEKLMRRIIPLGFEPRIDCLSGIAYFDENLVTGKTIQSLSVEDLPTNIQKRFFFLFVNFYFRNIFTGCNTYFRFKHFGKKKILSHILKIFVLVHPKLKNSFLNIAEFYAKKTANIFLLNSFKV